MADLFTLIDASSLSALKPCEYRILNPIRQETIAPVNISFTYYLYRMIRTFPNMETLEQSI